MPFGDDPLRCGLVDVGDGNIQVDGNLESASFVRSYADLAQDRNLAYVNFLLFGDMLHRTGETGRVAGSEEHLGVRQLGRASASGRVSKIELERSVRALDMAKTTTDRSDDAV